MTKEITTVTGHISSIIFVVLIGIGFIIWVFGAYHAIKAFRGAKPGKKLIAQLNPFGIFTEKYFTVEGNQHRKQSLKYGGYFLVVWVCAFGVWFVGYNFG